MAVSHHEDVAGLSPAHPPLLVPRVSPLEGAGVCVGVSPAVKLGLPEAHDHQWHLERGQDQDDLGGGDRDTGRVTCSTPRHPPICPPHHQGEGLSPPWAPATLHPSQLRGTGGGQCCPPP